MADVNSFFEGGIKSYIEKSFLKYIKKDEIIFDKNLDNILIQPLFINGISLYKSLIQKNKLKSEIWGLIGELYNQNINQLLLEYNNTVEKEKNKALKYIKYIQKSNDLINQYEQKVIEKRNECLNIIYQNITRDNNDNNIEEKNDLKDCNTDIYKNEKVLLKKIKKYRKEQEKEKINLSIYHKKLRHKEIKAIIGKIYILKLKIIQISLIILANEINSENMRNNNYNKEINYKLLNDYINDFIDEIEKNKKKLNLDYTLFIKKFIIQLALIINKQGYKDINISFLNQLLNSINNINKIYSNSQLSDLIKYLEKLISQPDIFLCRNAFTILKEASLKKIKPRSRSNSLEQNDILNNSNYHINNKNERNRKIDEFIKSKKTEEKSDDENENNELDSKKKLSNEICLKNNSIQNNKHFLNFKNQSNVGLSHDLLNLSKINSDDKMSKQRFMYSSGSYSKLLGINSRLASRMPALIKIKKENKKNNKEKYGEKINKERKNNKEKLDEILGNENRNIANNNFYNNEVNGKNNNNKNITLNKTIKDKDFV